MKKGKKLIAIIVSALMIVTLAIGLAACNKTNPNPTQKNVTVGMFWYKEDDLYLTSVRNQVEQTVFKGTNFIVKEFYANNDGATLKQLVTQNIADLDILVVNPVDGTDDTTLNAIVKVASDACKPIIFFNKEVSNDVLAQYAFAYYVGTVSKQSGVTEGTIMANYLIGSDKKLTNAVKYASTDVYNGNSGGLYTTAWGTTNASGVDMTSLKVIYYAMLRGQEGHADSDARTYWSVMQANSMLIPYGYILRPSPLMAQTTNLTLTDNPVGSLGLPLVTQEEKDIFAKFVGANDSWDGTTANNNFNSAFSTALGTPATLTSKLGVIFSNNDGMALAVVNGALKDAGYNKATTDTAYDAAKVIPIVGVDGDSANLQLIKDGSQIGTVLQSSKAYAQLFLYFCYIYSGDSASALALKSSSDFVVDGYTDNPSIKKLYFNYGVAV